MILKALIKPFDDDNDDDDDDDDDNDDDDDDENFYSLRITFYKVTYIYIYI